MRQGLPTKTRFTRGFTHYTLVTPGDDAPGGPPVDPDRARWIMAGFLGDFLSMRALRAFLRDQLGGDTRLMDDQQVLHVLARHLARGSFQLVCTPIALHHNYRLDRPSKKTNKTPAKRRAEQQGLTWLEIALVDETGAPLSGVRYLLVRGAATPAANGDLDRAGFARVDDLRPDSRYSVSFPELDASAPEPGRASPPPAGVPGQPSARIRARRAAHELIPVKSGRRNIIVVQLPLARVLDVEDKHFNFDRRVLLPDVAPVDGAIPVLDERRVTGLGVIYAALVHAGKHSAQRLFVTGHTDRRGTASYNRELSAERARNVSLLLRGERDAWRELSARRDAVDDYQTVLQWLHRRAGWDCDPGPVTNRLTARTRTAIGRFQAIYNEEVERAAQAGWDSPFRARIGVDRDVGSETWGAFYDVYMNELMALLGLGDYSELARMQRQLRAPPGMPDFAGCGEHFPADVTLRRPYDGASDERLEGPERNPTDRRVEILFLDPGEETPLPCHPAPKGCSPARCPVYNVFAYRLEPIGIPKGLKVAEVNLRLTFLDPEGKSRPFPAGVDLRLRFGDPAAPPAPEGGDDLARPDDGTRSREGGSAATKPEATGGKGGGTAEDPPVCAVPQEPAARTGPGGVARFVIPRRESTFYLQVIPDPARRHVTADPRKLDDQRLCSREQALAEAGKGRVYFKLPEELFDTLGGYFTAPPAVRFKDGKFLEIDSRQTQIGSREQPAELKLAIRWQHYRFDYHDRWTESPATVPQPRSKKADGTVHLLELHGVAGADGDTDETCAVWDVQSGKHTLHCLPWLRRLGSGQPEAGANGASAALRELPDQDCRSFFKAKGLFVRTQGDGARDLVEFAAGDATPTTPGAERLRLYDLPEEWRSTDYPARLGGQGLDRIRKLQELCARASSKTRPYVVSLDTVVLAGDGGKAPEAGLAWDDRKLENRFTLLDSKLAVHKPDTRSGETYFTDLAGLDRRPDGPVLHDLPGHTRVVARGATLYHLFDRRVPADEAFEGCPIGARLAERFAPGKEPEKGSFCLASTEYSSTLTESRTNGMITFEKIGWATVLLLRCCGHDGAVELFQFLQYQSVHFDFAPQGPHPKGAVPLDAPPPANQQRNHSRDALLLIARRWNGRDSVNSDPATFHVGKPEKARGALRMLLVRGPPGTPRTVVSIYKEVRAHMEHQTGAWRLVDMKPRSDGWFVGAHEIGHMMSLPDEYNEPAEEPSVRLPSISDRRRAAGAPYDFDRNALMREANCVRTRYFWHLLLWGRHLGAFAKETRASIEHGRHRFSTALTKPDENRVNVPVLSRTNVAVGALGLCDLFAYVTGHDAWTAGGLGGSSPANPYDGFIAVRVNMAWSFASTTRYGAIHSLLHKASERIQEALNETRHVIARVRFEGRTLRLRLLFSPRFVCRTCPTGEKAAEYLADIDWPEGAAQDAAGYRTLVNTRVAENGVHAEVLVRKDAAPGGVTRKSAPRVGVVREDKPILWVFSNDRFDDDVLLLFRQLIGVRGDLDRGSSYGPLLAPLGPRMKVTGLEVMKP